MPHADRERELQISLATALRELDEARTDAANLRFVNDKARESLAAANARADAAEVELRVSGAAYGSLQDALATARRECEGLRKALTALLHEVEESGNGDARDFGWGHALKLTRAALAGPAPAPGEETKR